MRMMEEYRQLWISVSQLVRNFGACYSFTLTVHLLVHSLVFVFLVYNFVGLSSLHLQQKDYYGFAKLFAAPWIPFAMIYYCCNLGHLIAKNVSVTR